MFTKYDKAIFGFIASFISALMAQVQAGVSVGWKVLLLSLGVAFVTSFSVYQVKNKES